MTPEEVLRALERYQRDLDQLQQILKTDGKSHAAIALIQNLTSQDIGMLSWSVPDGWRSDPSDFGSRLATILTAIQRQADSIRRDFIPRESGLPTVTMLVDRITVTMARLMEAPETPPKLAPPPTDPVATQPPGLLARIFPFLAPKPDIKALARAADLAGLAAAVNHPSRRIRLEAVAALGEMPTLPAAEALTRALNGADAAVKEAAKKALELNRVGQKAEAKDAAGLLGCLTEGGVEARVLAAKFLGQMHAQEAVPVLAAWLEGEDEKLAEAAVGALKQLGGKEAEAALKKYLDRQRKERLEALEAEIDWLTSAGDINGLIEKLKDEDLNWELQDKITNALFGQGIKALVPLLQALGDPQRMAGLIQAKQQGMLTEGAIKAGIAFAAADYRRKFEK